MTRVKLLVFTLFFSGLVSAQNIGIGTNIPDPAALVHMVSTNKGLMIPQVSIDSLTDVLSIPSPVNGLLVYNTLTPGLLGDMQRGFYYYSIYANSWVRLADNLNDNYWQSGGLLGIQLRNRNNGVEMQDTYSGANVNWNPKVKMLKVMDSSLMNTKRNIPVLTLTGVEKKTVAGWDSRMKTSIVFENNYLLADGSTSASANNVAISSYVENAGVSPGTQSNGLAFYVTAPPQNTAVADTPSVSMFRHNIGIGAYATDVNNFTDGRLQVTGFSSADQLSLRNPNNIIFKWGFYVSSIDSSLNLYYNGSQRVVIDRVTGAYTALSDRNLKKNIQELPPVLNTIMHLPAYIYNYKDSRDEDRKAIGFMAQDVEPYFPDLVFHKTDRETGAPFLMMTYQSFGVIAIRAIQEQQALINTQQNKIDALEKRLEALEKVVTGKK